MSVDTLGVKFTAEGSENILNMIKQITSATGQLETEIKKLSTTSQQASSGIGPAFSNLGNAMSSGEVKVKSLTEKFGGLQSAVLKQGTAFGTASASIWGIYNAYDSLEKVQLRASQSTVRVETLTTSLRSQEEQLKLARESGNLTAEQVAVKEERITDVKQKLGVAQERERILTEDVSEAWAGFASLIGPQVLAATGSISQLVVGLTSHMEGQVSTVGKMKNAFMSLIGTFTTTRVSGLGVNSTFAQMPIFAGAAEVGVRGLSGALKGLLIGTGIGAIVVAIGLLVESFDLLGTASATATDEVTNNFKEGENAPFEYGNAVRTNMEKATAIIKKYGSDTKIILAEASAAYIQNVIDEISADKIRMDAAAKKAKVLYDAKNLEIENIEKQRNYVGRLTFDQMKQEEDAMKIRATAAESYETSTQIVNNYGTQLLELGKIHTEVAEKEKVLTEQHILASSGISELADAWKNTFGSMHTVVDQWLKDNEGMILGFKGSSNEAKVVAQSWAKTAFGGDLLSAATERLNAGIETLLPNEEKAAKTAEKHADLIDKLAIKARELEDTFGVTVPTALLTNEKGLDAFAKTLERTKGKMDEFKKATEFLRDITGLEKAFKIEFETDKEVKDFIKDLPKETKKKIKIIIDNISDWQGVKDIFTIIAPGIFRTNTVTNEQGQTILRVGIRPELNNPKDISNIADTMINAIEDQFGKSTKKDPVLKNIIKNLKSADTETELINAFKQWGVWADQTILEGVDNTGKEIVDKLTEGVKNNLGPLQSIISTAVTPGQEGITTFDKNGKPINTPINKDGGKTDFSAEIKSAQEADSKITQIFLTLTGKLSNIWIGMAKNWSGMMNSVIINSKAADIGVMKEFNKMVSTAEGKFSELAGNWSSMMNSMINNAKSAASGVNKALDGIKDQDVTINVGLSGPGVPYLHHSSGAIHLGKGGIIDSAAAGQIYMTNGPQLVLIGDNPGGNEIHAMIPKNDPMPTVRSLLGVLGNMGHNTTSNISNNSSISNFNNGPINIQIVSPVYLDSKLIGENISNQTIDNLDRFYHA